MKLLELLDQLLMAFYPATSCYDDADQGYATSVTMKVSPLTGNIYMTDVKMIRPVSEG